MKVHELICKRLKKRSQDIPVNSNLIIEFNEIMDDVIKKAPKSNKYRKTIITYKFGENSKNVQNNKNIYRNLILALSKKNYLDKMFNKEDIKNNKINIKLMQFLGVTKPGTQNQKKKHEIKNENN